MTARVSGCQVKNSNTGHPHPRLQAAVDAAKPGVLLVVQGVCHGGAVIDKDLAIGGLRTRTSGRAILAGDDRTRILPIEAGARLTLRTLVI